MDIEGGSFRIRPNRILDNLYQMDNRYSVGGGGLGRLVEEEEEVVALVVSAIRFRQRNTCGRCLGDAEVCSRHFCNRREESTLVPTESEYTHRDSRLSPSPTQADGREERKSGNRSLSPDFADSS